MARLTGAEVAQHSSAASCWVVLHGQAYDVTDFLPGKQGLLRLIPATDARQRSRDADEA